MHPYTDSAIGIGVSLVQAGNVAMTVSSDKIEVLNKLFE